MAKLLDLPVDKVTVNVTLLGGGFGRKSKCDYVLEGALLSKALGVPVQVQWTREDDVRNGFYHAVAVERIEGGLDADKKVVAWRHRSTSPTIMSTFKPGMEHLGLRRAVGIVSDRYRPASSRGGACRRKGRLGRKLAPGARAWHRRFVSYVATAVEVAVDDKGELSVPRPQTAIDCGFHVNPERIASQVEGAAVMGLSLAKHGQITFKDGRGQ